MYKPSGFTAFTLSLLLAIPCTARAADSAPSSSATDTLRAQRLHHVARLWGEVRYRHPYFAYKDIDWDAALVRAIPRVEAAQDRDAYARAVQEMLDVLGDPVTQVDREEETNKPPAEKPTPRALRSFEGEVLVLDLRAALELPFPGLESQLEGLRRDLSRARSVVIDLRARGFSGSAKWRISTAFERTVPSLIPWELRTPGVRHVVYEGFRSQSGLATGYDMSLVTSSGAAIAPEGDRKRRPLVVLLDEESYVDSTALALQSSGLATFVSEGKLTQEGVIFQDTVDLGEQLRARLRLSDFDAPIRADIEVPPRKLGESGGAALQVALKLARKRLQAAPRQAPPKVSAEATWRPDKKYATPSYPDREHRLLALVKLWTVIRLFYPYRELLDRDWEAAFPELLPTFEAASDETEYALAVARMATLIQDGHTNVSGPTIKKIFGSSGLPFQVLEIERRPTVVKVLDPALAPGLKVGDVIEKIDGAPFDERVRRLEKYFTASTEVYRRMRLLRMALMGEEASSSVLTVHDGIGQRQVTFKRPPLGWMPPSLPDEPYRILEENIGYVDMTRLEAAQVDAMFQALKDTRAIVFDMRGYPRGVFWVMTPYLNTRNARVAAIFERCNASGAANFHGRTRFLQHIEQKDVPLYRGRTVMLIDERAISQSEHTGLWFEAANGTTFIGSPTAGANGDVTDMVLPGDLLRVLFTGHDVRHADGRQLQRVGLQPHIGVRPTLAGLRAGKDEVLERTLAFLKQPSEAPSNTTTGPGNAPK